MWLALDTTTDWLSLCVGGGSLPEQDWKTFDRHHPRGHARDLVTEVKDLLETAHISFQDLEGIAVATGPGSFTGIRIGLATVQGWGVALDSCLVGVSVFMSHTMRAFSLGAAAESCVTMIPSTGDQAFVHALDQNLNPIPGPFEIPVLLSRVDIQRYLQEWSGITGGASILISDDGGLLAEFQGFRTCLLPIEGRAVGTLKTALQMEVRADESSLHPLYIKPSYIKETGAI